MRSFDSNVAIRVKQSFQQLFSRQAEKVQVLPEVTSHELARPTVDAGKNRSFFANLELFLQHLLSISHQILQKQREFVDSALHFIGTARIAVRFDCFLLLALLHLGEDGPLKLQLLLHKLRGGDLLFEQVTPDHGYKLNMEQNQRQPTPQVAPQEQQWNATRNEFANEGEAIGESEDVAALVQKWVWIQHEEQFKKYEGQLQEHEGGIHTLQSLIGQFIQQQKEESWMINQRYTMEQVNHIIEKLREKVKEVLKSGTNLNPEAQVSVNQAQEKENSRNAVETQLQNGIEKEVYVNNSSIFPQIKPKGRLLNPKEMHSSFHLLKQTEEQYKIQSPSMFALDKRTKDIHRQGIFNNKYLRQTFKWLSKQGYNYKGLFQDFSKEGDRMNLNKWMVFCKEFDFTEKLPKKDLVSIFQTATKFSSNMFIEDFLTAVALLQDKYVTRYHKGQQNFVAEVLQINSQASFKVKMDNLKVNYSGPRKNFFEQGTYPEHERAQQMQRQKQFQTKKREREIVLIKGMFQEHIKDEVKQLKANRQKMKVNRLGSSLNMIEIKQKSKEKELPYKTARLQELNYSKLFQLNRGIANESNTTTANTRMYNTQLAKGDLKPHKIEHKRIDADKNKKNESEQKRIQAKAAQTHRNQMPQKSNFNVSKQKPVPIIQETPPGRTWLTNVRSDSQESDDILKQHLQFEKRVKQTKVQKLMKEMKERSRQVDKIHEQLKRQEEQQVDGDMVQTQVNFNKIAV